MINDSKDTLTEVAAGQGCFMRSCFRSGLKGIESCPEKSSLYITLGSPCIYLPLIKNYNVSRKKKIKGYPIKQIMNCTACENSAHSTEDNLALSPLMPACLCDIFPLHNSLPWFRGKSGKLPLGETVPEKPACQARGIFSLRYKASKGLRLIAAAQEFLAPSSGIMLEMERTGTRKKLGKSW